ncbi:hypothetical protein Tco_1247480 [Tanacetum coccineum]
MNVHFLQLELVHDLRIFPRNGIYQELLLHPDMMAMKRFIDIDQGQKLHLWRSDPVQTIFLLNLLHSARFGSTKQANKGCSVLHLGLQLDKILVQRIPPIKVTTTLDFFQRFLHSVYRKVSNVPSQDLLPFLIESLISAAK